MAMGASAATSASEVLKTSAGKLRKMPSLTADITISGQQGSSAAKILLSGEKFALTSRGAQSVWFDGKTQWVYNPAVDEVNITTPTADELAQINPFKVISSFQNSYSPRLLKAPAGSYVVELTPKSSRSDFKTVVITFDAKSYLPIKVVLATKSMGTATVGISNIRQGAKVGASKFAPTKKEFPTAEFIDLR